MSIIITNEYLPAVCSLLEELPLAGRASRARSKVLEMARQAAASLAQSEIDLASQYAICTPEGKPAINAEGSIEFATPHKAQAFLSEQQALLAERAILTGQTYTSMAATLYQALIDTNEPFSGEQARAYNHLCEALETHLDLIKKNDTGGENNE